MSRPNMPAKRVTASPQFDPNGSGRVRSKADIFDGLFRPFADTATGDARMGGVLVDKSAGPARQWQVLLLGGPSGVGKTAVSYRLARYFGVGITEVDDFQVLLERMTTVEQQPAIHFRLTH